MKLLKEQQDKLKSTKESVILEKQVRKQKITEKIEKIVEKVEKSVRPKMEFVECDDDSESEGEVSIDIGKPLPTSPDLKGSIISPAQSGKKKFKF